MSDAERIEEIAAAWLAREDRGPTHDEAEGLQAWLQDDVRHRVAYLRLKASWRSADRLGALRQAPVVQAPRDFRGLYAAAAACLFLCLAAGGMYYAHTPQARPVIAKDVVYATDVGRTQNVRLADGSHIELNTNTRVQAKVTEGRRTVSLLRGEAFFDVVHDEKRPFVVYAGNRRIVDLGTKFSVFRNGNDVQVIVQQGRVRVDILNSPEVSAPVSADAGHVVLARSDATLVLGRPPQEIENDLSWRRGLLIFSQDTLAEVAEQFNRYNVKQVVVQGAARDIRIGGSFKADNVEAFTALIRDGFGLTVRDVGDQIIVSG